MNSILTTIKKLLGIEEEYTHFDSDIIVYINSAFTRLKQLGVGPENGFSITDPTTLWSDYIGEDTTFGDIQSYIYLKVRLIFDPPTSSFAVEAIERQIKELEWCISVDNTT